jgi:hypothetical protein
MCCDEINKNNIIMKSCNHVFSICNECINKLKKINGKYKCPYCNLHTNIEKIYLMN